MNKQAKAGLVLLLMVSLLGTCNDKESSVTNINESCCYDLKMDTASSIDETATDTSEVCFQ